MPEVLSSEFKTKETTMKSYEKCVKLLSYGPCVALIGSLLIGSPQGFAQNAESSPSEPLRLTVAPHTSSAVPTELRWKLIPWVRLSSSTGVPFPGCSFT